MKKLLLTFLEPATATLLVVIAIGLGIEAHPVFFLLALAIAIAALDEALINAALARRPHENANSNRGCVVGVVAGSAPFSVCDPCETGSGREEWHDRYGQNALIQRGRARAARELANCTHIRRRRGGGMF